MYEFLAVQRINAIWPDIFFALQQNQDMRWTQGAKAKVGGVVSSSGPRIPSRPSTLGEIHARINDRAVIAPIIIRGQSAPLRTPNPTVRLEQTNIPKIKHGMMIDEPMLRVLARIEANLSGVPSIDNEDVQSFLNFEQRQLMNLALGVNYRLEHLAVGMLLDSYTYANDAGVVFSMSWGAPSDTKVTVGTNWGDGTAGISHGAPTATPISDINVFSTNMLTNYGAMFNRITISRQGFDYILNTNEFKALAPLYFSNQSGLAPTFAAIQSANREMMRDVFSNMISMEVEFDDRTVMVEQKDLTLWNAPPAAPANGQYIRYMPVNKVILTNTMNDGDVNTWDVANLPVLESLPGMVPGIVGKAPQGGARGPFAYAAATSLTGDPPGKSLWAVQEAVPEKKALLSSASMTIF